MPKGYWIANVDVRNADGFKGYTAALPEVLRKYGARYLTRGGRTEVMEGNSRSRIIIMEFPSYDAAMDCYRSPEYTKAVALRQPHADADVIVIEGYDGPQP